MTCGERASARTARNEKGRPRAPFVHPDSGPRSGDQFVRELCFCRYAINPSIPPDASWLLNWPW